MIKIMSSLSEIKSQSWDFLKINQNLDLKQELTLGAVTKEVDRFQYGFMAFCVQNRSDNHI